MALGASVAHNGCCLTVTRVEGDLVSFDLMQETLRLTNLGKLQVGDKVNVERAARFGDEIGGHAMSGHIIGMAEVTSVIDTPNNRQVWYRLAPELMKYVLTKGYIGIDGISLTIGEVREREFCVHLIPRHWPAPTWVGSRLAGRPISRLIHRPRPSSIRWSGYWRRAGVTERKRLGVNPLISKGLQCAGPCYSCGENLYSIFCDSQLKQLLVVCIHKQLQTVAGFVAVKPQVDWIATGHAIFVKLLITLAGIQLDPGMVTAVGADDALAGVLNHDNLLGPWGRLSTLILVGLQGVNREQTHVYDRDQA